MKELSQILLEQTKNKPEGLVLRYEAPVLPFLPPFLLKDIPEGQIREIDYHFEVFEKPADLKKKFPKAHLRRGHPCEIHQFLSGSDMFLDFDQLGCVSLSHEASGERLPISKMGRWLDYALSPELWGTEGKWNRFHERLHKLFENQNLLEGIDLPGYYPLKSDACSWEKLPLQGDHQNGVFALILPWTFSLTDLRKLESLVNEEK
jgi:hypothetical protein